MAKAKYDRKVLKNRTNEIRKRQGSPITQMDNLNISQKSQIEYTYAVVYVCSVILMKFSFCIKVIDPVEKIKINKIVMQEKLDYFVVCQAK